ncbi:MAG: hypothetical protein INR73_10840 [Williamsia sp.]|nr:hypothetical protein [Williamsia sp.]
MKIHPSKQIKREVVTGDRELTATERITKWIALIVAGVTVYFFFIKILFL